MAFPLCLLVSVGGRRFQRLGPSPTLESLGPSHQWRHKSGVSLRGPPCAHGVLGTPHGAVCDIYRVRTGNYDYSNWKQALFGERIPKHYGKKIKIWHLLRGITLWTIWIKHNDRVFNLEQ